SSLPGPASPWSTSSLVLRLPGPPPPWSTFSLVLQLPPWSCSTVVECYGASHGPDVLEKPCAHVCVFVCVCVCACVGVGVHTYFLGRQQMHCMKDIMKKLSKKNKTCLKKYLSVCVVS